MTIQEQAYSEIERLVKNFKGMPAAQRKGLNEMQTRLGYMLPITNPTHFAKNGAIMQIRIAALLACEPYLSQLIINV